MFTCLSLRAEPPPVIIDYFFEAGCAECGKVRSQVLPELKERFEGFYILNNYDVGVVSNVARLVAYQEKFNIASNKPVMMVVDYRHILNGFDAIKAGLLNQVDEALAERQEPGWKVPEPMAIAADPLKAAKGRLGGFTLKLIILAGLVDGLNHCAISTLVFFLSLLAVSKVQGRSFLLMVVPFCLASFFTYFAIGLGLLRTLQLMNGFEGLRRGLNIFVLCVLVVMAGWSFLDAWRFRRSGRAADVDLKLPGFVMALIHRIMRRGVGGGSLVIGGLVIGALVTALEGICTGQVYVPTLAVLARSGAATGKCVGYLFAYNVASDVPLVLLLVLSYFGLRTHTLLEWSRRNVVVSKVLMGVFFLALAVLVVKL